MEKKDLRSACLEKIKNTPSEKIIKLGEEVCEIVTKTEKWKRKS